MSKDNYLLILIMIIFLSGCQGPDQGNNPPHKEATATSEASLQKVPAIEQPLIIESSQEDQTTSFENDQPDPETSDDGLLGTAKSRDNHQNIGGIPELIIPDGHTQVPSTSSQEPSTSQEETSLIEKVGSDVTSGHLSGSSSKESQEIDAVQDETPNLSGIDYSQYQNISEVIRSLIKEYDLPEKNLGIVYENRITNERFYLNENKAAYAASTNKVGLATLYIDQIYKGTIDWQTKLPASPKSFQAGDGLISNSPLKSSYDLEDLMFNLIVYSDNTAWRIMLDYYNDHYGDVKKSLLKASKIDPLSKPLIDNYNYATPNLLNTFLNKIADSSRYDKLKDFMLEAQPHLRFKLYHDEGMATKYGQYNNVYHDTGIYYENGQPVYTLVLMTIDVGMVDTFMGELNLRINEWYHYQEGRLAKVELFSE
ncbi:serine hydrolase [Facklamia languida]